MSTLMLASDKRPEDACRDAGLIVHLEERDLGLVFRIGDAAHDLLFHDLILVANNGSGIFDIVETERLHGFGRNEARQDARLDLVDHRQFNRARLQYLRSERRHLQHFFVGDFRQAPGFWDDARISCVDTVDIGVDIANIGIKRDGNGNSARIRSTAAKCRDAIISRLDALKSRDDCNFAALDALSNFSARHVGDARRTVRRIGLDRYLPTGPGARLVTHRLQHDRKQPGGDLFSGPDDGIILAHVVEV